LTVGKAPDIVPVVASGNAGFDRGVTPISLGIIGRSGKTGRQDVVTTQGD
jgi:hypothetical protein